jgi:hypothetical protein
MIIKNAALQSWTRHLMAQHHDKPASAGSKEAIVSRPWAGPHQAVDTERLAGFSPMERWLDQTVREEPWYDIYSVSTRREEGIGAPDGGTEDQNAHWKCLRKNLGGGRMFYHALVWADKY